MFLHLSVIGAPSFGVWPNEKNIYFPSFGGQNLWDQHGVVQEVLQEEERGWGWDEQSDALMPALFALSQHSASEAVQRCSLRRVSSHFWTDFSHFTHQTASMPLCKFHARIQAHHGKTQQRNWDGLRPEETSSGGRCLPPFFRAKHPQSRHSWVSLGPAQE